MEELFKKCREVTDATDRMLTLVHLGYCYLNQEYGDVWAASFVMSDSFLLDRLAALEELPFTAYAFGPEGAIKKALALFDR